MFYSPRYGVGWVFGLFLLSGVGGFERPAELSLDDDRFFHFVTRPEIRASRWNITTFDTADSIQPGYWFVGPYEVLDQPPDVGEPGWIGPHIYDHRGELVWSGASLFENYNIEDFRISEVSGQDLMTLIDQHTGRGMLMDEMYEVIAKPEIDDPENVNTHEFNFVDGGKRVLVIKNDEREASREQSEEIGFDGNCVAKYEHFQELDTESWEVVFDWDSMDHVRLNESTLTEEEDLEDRCSGWDFFHSNSVDKTANGDYLISARHMDTIYKVSGEDGHIIWRLGGVISDFGAGEWTFSRQHDVRVREENSTHLVISILDNARGIDTQDPSYPMSRGLLLALNEQEMTVTILKQIDHPHGEGNYAPRRGNYQILPNGNIFMGWSELAAQSEHSPDGTILMHSWLMADWLGTYRNYKFQSFTGRPTEKPAVHSIAFPTDGGASMTIVHVSWNGDTEVARWNLYKTTPVDDEVRVLVGSADREGFETAIEFGGLASFVVLEGVDANGEVLGESDIVKTITSTNVTDTALSAEAEWEDTATKARRRQFFNNPTVVFCLGLVSGAMTALVFTLVWRRRGTSLPRMNIPRWVVPGYEKLVRVGGVPGQDVSLDRLKQWKTDGGEDSSVDDVEAEPLRPPSRDSLDFVGEGPDK